MSAHVMKLISKLIKSFLGLRKFKIGSFIEWWIWRRFQKPVDDKAIPNRINR